MRKTEEKYPAKENRLKQRKLELELEKMRLEVQGLKSKREKWLRFIPLFTALIAVIGVWISVNQFNSQQEEQQKWKEAEFIRTSIKAFDSNPGVENTKLMLDSLQLYQGGRVIDLFPKEAETTKRYQKVTPGDIFNALELDKEKLEGESEETQAKWIAITDSFDAFLSNLEQFDIDIDSGLVTAEDIKTDLIYWFALMTDENIRLKIPEFRQRLWAYIDRYKFDRVRSLIKKCNPYPWYKLV